MWMRGWLALIAFACAAADWLVRRPESGVWLFSPDADAAHRFVPSVVIDVYVYAGAKSDGR